jgi:DNA-binding response OmpR family regulator/signal transduction histidine kinase
LPHLFERFHRVKGAQGRTFEGSGIGLALVQELAKLHGGTVRVESKEGHGTTFTVSVPLGSDHLPADRIGGHRSSISTINGSEAYLQEVLRWLPNSSESSLDLPVLPSSITSEVGAERRSEHAPPRILLADDNADMRSYLQGLLQGPYELVAVADGQSALESARQHPPDLVLADVMMPRLDGFGLLRELRADQTLNGIPVLLVSARAGEESRIEGLAAGADDYLVKPFSARELVARVGSQLAMARVRREAADTERKLRAEAEAEAEALVKLNKWSGQLWRSRSLKEGLDEMLAAAINLLNAQKGNIQMLEHDHLRLTIGAQRGFGKEFLDFFRQVTASDDSACGRALRAGERVIVEDVEADESFAPLRPIARRAGFKAVISTPLIGADGTFLGVLSIHFGAAHRPSKADLQRLDLYVRQATDFIQRCRIEEALRRSEEQFRKLSETLDAEVRARTKELEERNNEVLRQSERVRAISGRLLRAQDEERRRIARELHDSAGQTLTVLGMDLAQFVQKAGQNVPELTIEAEAIQEMVQQLHREIRTTSYLLHPPLLDQVGLYSALSWYTQGLTERSGLEIELDISEEFGR